MPEPDELRELRERLEALETWRARFYVDDSGFVRDATTWPWPS